MFPNFASRLQKELSSIVDQRLQIVKQHPAAVNQNPEPLTVKVTGHSNQRYAVWSGGALFASMPEFPSYCVSREEYAERGPSACRQSKVFGSLVL